MPKKITFGLSKKEVERAKQELLAYENNLRAKVAIFVERLADIGIDVSRATMNAASAFTETGTWETSVELTSGTTQAHATVNLEGDKILFVEFGAGNRYASPQNPKASELGYGPGTYPGQTHVPIPGFWYYKDENGKRHFSAGNHAMMPMYYASEAMREEISKIAKEVFGSD